MKCNLWGLRERKPDSCRLVKQTDTGLNGSMSETVYHKQGNIYPE